MSFKSNWLVGLRTSPWLKSCLVLLLWPMQSCSFGTDICRSHNNSPLFELQYSLGSRIAQRQHSSLRMSDNDNDNYEDPWADDPWVDNFHEEQVESEYGDGRPSDEELYQTLTEWDDKIARFNTVHLVGRIGNDPEPRYFDDGKVVVNLNLACRRKYHYLERKALDIKSGKEETDWYGLEIWGPTAEYVSKYVDKGTRAGVVGSLQVDTWTDKTTGEPRSKAKVIVREFDVLETKGESDLRRNNRRSSSFYTTSDDDRFDQYDPSQGSAGGFFDS